MSPNFADAHDNRASALASPGTIADAVGEVLEAIRLRPECADFSRNAAGVFSKRGDVAEAMRRLEDALALDPQNVAAQQMLDDLRRRPK